MSNPRYTISEINVLWDQYMDTKRLRVLTGGKWELFPLKTDLAGLGATSAAVVRLKDFKTFPQYLEELTK
jgi:hypothetical protein